MRKTIDFELAIGTISKVFNENITCAKEIAKKETDPLRIAEIDNDIDFIKDLEKEIIDKLNNL